MGILSFGLAGATQGAGQGAAEAGKMWLGHEFEKEKQNILNQRAVSLQEMQGVQAMDRTNVQETGANERARLLRDENARIGRERETAEQLRHTERSARDLQQHEQVFQELKNRSKLLEKSLENKDIPMSGKIEADRLQRRETALSAMIRDAVKEGQYDPIPDKKTGKTTLTPIRQHIDREFASINTGYDNFIKRYGNKGDVAAPGPGPDTDPLGVRRPGDRDTTRGPGDSGGPVLDQSRGILDREVPRPTFGGRGTIYGPLTPEEMLQQGIDQGNPKAIAEAERRKKSGAMDAQVLESVGGL